MKLAGTNTFDHSVKSISDEHEALLLTPGKLAIKNVEVSFTQFFSVKLTHDKNKGVVRILHFSRDFTVVEYFDL